MKKLGYCLLLFLISCNNNQSINQNSNGVIQEEFLEEVITIQAEQKPLQKEFTCTGKVTADPDRTIAYSPLVSGVVVKTYFSLGDFVHKGQTLLDIRSTELSALQSELIIAHRNLKSIEALFETGLATHREVVEARSINEKLEADLALYGESKGNGIFSITAPMSGYVIEKYGIAGSTFSPEGNPLFSIADLTSIWVVANIYAGNIQFVQKGQNVEISSVAYPHEVFTGSIHFISQVFDTEDKALKARIIMPNKELKLKPEMSVVVKIFNESKIQIVAIPSDAVIFDSNRHFVVTGSKDFAIREIVPIDHHNGDTYVSQGINVGQEIVIKNQLLIYNELKGK